jgi:hypothetical protein
MKRENRKFYWLLRAIKDERGKRIWTTQTLAEAIYCTRPRLTDVLNNKADIPGRGKRLRPILVKFFKKEFPEDGQAGVTWRQLIAALGWDANGNLCPGEQKVPCGTQRPQPLTPALSPSDGAREFTEE